MLDIGLWRMRIGLFDGLKRKTRRKRERQDGGKSHAAGVTDVLLCFVGLWCLGMTLWCVIDMNGVAFGRQTLSNKTHKIIPSGTLNEMPSQRYMLHSCSARSAIGRLVLGHTGALMCGPEPVFQWQKLQSSEILSDASECMQNLDWSELLSMVNQAAPCVIPCSSMSMSLIIVFLLKKLLLSGDVESNPGPEGDTNPTDPLSDPKPDPNHNSNDLNSNPSIEVNRLIQEETKKIESKLDTKFLSMENQIQHLTTIMQSISKSFTTQSESMNRMEQKQENIANKQAVMSRKQADMSDTLNQLCNEVMEAKEEMQNTQRTVKQLEEKQDNTFHRIDALEEEIDRLERFSRRNNLKIFGLRETSAVSESENCEELVKELLERYIPDESWDDDVVERAHRLGKRNTFGYQPRPVIAKILRWKDVLRVLRNTEARDRMKKDGIRISQDRTRRQAEELKRLRAMGKIGYFVRGKLFVKEDNGRRNSLSRSREERNDTRMDTQNVTREEEGMGTQGVSSALGAMNLHNWRTKSDVSGIRDGRDWDREWDAEKKRMSEKARESELVKERRRDKTNQSESIKQWLRNNDWCRKDIDENQCGSGSARNERKEECMQVLESKDDSGADVREGEKGNDEASASSADVQLSWKELENVVNDSVNVSDQEHECSVNGDAIMSEELGGIIRDNEEEGQKLDESEQNNPSANVMSTAKLVQNGCTLPQRPHTPEDSADDACCSNAHVSCQKGHVSERYENARNTNETRARDACACERETTELNSEASPSMFSGSAVVQPRIQTRNASLLAKVDKSKKLIEGRGSKTKTGGPRQAQFDMSTWSGHPVKDVGDKQVGGEKTRTSTSTNNKPTLRSNSSSVKQGNKHASKQTGGAQSHTPGKDKKH